MLCFRLAQVVEMLCFRLAQVVQMLCFRLAQVVEMLCFRLAQVVEMLFFRLEQCYLVTTQLPRNNILTNHWLYIYAIIVDFQCSSQKQVG